MALLRLEAILFCVISSTAAAVGADYDKLTEATPIVSANKMYTKSLQCSFWHYMIHDRGRKLLSYPIFSR